MKKVYNLLLIIALPSILVLYSYNSGSPGGKSGSTGDGGSTCTECHSGTAQPQSARRSIFLTSDLAPSGHTNFNFLSSNSYSGVVFAAKAILPKHLSIILGNFESP